MAVERGLAVSFDVPTEWCAVTEIAYERHDGTLSTRALARCGASAELVWLGMAGLCVSHVLLMWPHLAERH